IYPALLPALQGAARETVLAHLVKLGEDGRARRDGEAWTRLR
ncbi:MAG: MBL fold metallo-hydrolase, partial [Acidobacteria bacterium]|nr:MBL fold metallo-hydrolase [Acidobacteriota bacterium]